MSVFDNATVTAKVHDAAAAMAANSTAVGDAAHGSGFAQVTVLHLHDNKTSKLHKKRTLAKRFYNVGFDMSSNIL